MDPAAPDDDYKLTYNCLACPDNSRTYNDGYHILHHANSRLHWSELPSAFIQQLHLHDDKDGEEAHMCTHGFCFCEAEHQSQLCVNVQHGRSVLLLSLTKHQLLTVPGTAQPPCSCASSFYNMATLLTTLLAPLPPTPHPHPHPPIPPPQSALVFANIGFFDVGVAVFTRRLGWLADRVVPCGPKQARRSREDWVALLQQRLVPTARKGGSKRS